MKLTPQVKEWLVKNRGVKADASDEEFKAAYSTAFKDYMDGKEGANVLTPEVLTALNTSEGGKVAGGVMGLLEKLVSRVEAIENKNTTVPAPVVSGATVPAPSGTRTPSVLEKTLAGGDNTGALDTSNVRVKGAHEQYSTTKSAAMFPIKDQHGRSNSMSGQRITEGYFGKPGYRELETTSELEKACIGAFMKWAINVDLKGRPIPRCFIMTQHDTELLEYAKHHLPWGGVLGGDCESVPSSTAVKGRLLTDHERKTLMDDASSGGLEIAPIAFDDDIIMTPILKGELYPKVKVVPITRGRRIEGAAAANVTVTWGGSDDTDIALFNTASFISAFDTSIFVVDGAIEIGLDFVSDSPIDVANMVSGQYGDVLLKSLDDVVATGNGTTQPEGIMVSGGTTSVSFSNSAATVGKYESLLFGVPKQYKQGFPNDRIVFCGSETSYARARAIPVGASDERRVFGMDEESYTLFQHPYAINSSMGNTKIFFCVMARYRMYRRLGLTMKVTTEGKTLVRGNKMLITARARYGGQLEDGAACALTTTAAA